MNASLEKTIAKNAKVKSATPEIPKVVLVSVTALLQGDTIERQGQYYRVLNATTSDHFTTLLVRKKQLESFRLRIPRTSILIIVMRASKECMRLTLPNHHLVRIVGEKR